MKRLALLGTAMALVMALAVVVPGYATPPSTFQVPPAHSRLNHPFQKGMVLTITGSGTAYNLTDQSQHQTASLQLTVTVERASFGRALVKVNSGSLMIGTTSYTVAGGRGIINFHSGRMLLHVNLKNASGAMFHLVLYGKATGQITSLSVGNSFTVDFAKPQSKLAGHWFLQFNSATVTRTK